MAPRKKIPPTTGAAGSAEVTSRPKPRKTPKMLRRMVHNDRIFEIGDDCPVTGKDLERWQRNGFADHG